MKNFPAIALLVFLIAPVPAAQAKKLAAAQEPVRTAMAPHKAIYDIEMVSRKSSAQVLNVGGRMFFESRNGCDAWTTDHRFTLQYDYADSPPMQVSSDFSTYETFDGASFDYSSRRKRGGTLYQELRGRAERADDGTGKAVYTQPPTLSFDLVRGTLFPMAHTLEVLESAKKGKKFFQSVVFDGSDEEGPVEINAFIGKKVNAMAQLSPGKDIDADLLNTPAWKVRLAFFPVSAPESDSDYEMSVIFHENGIISDMLVEYRDFSVTQKLVALEKLPPAACKDPIP